jgi:predicted RNA-binding protein with PIN domain
MNQPTPPTEARLLVDGYNVIGAWNWLKTVRDREGLETARRDLIEALIGYAAFKSYETQIVFDAHYQNTPSYTEPHTSLLSVHYTAFSQTADTYIEKICASHFRQRDDRNRRLIVATSDRDQRLTAIGYGAEWLSTKHLADEIDLASNKIKCRKRPIKKSSGRFLFNSLDPKSQQALEKWLH